jgi:hypothetical protein
MSGPATSRTARNVDPMRDENKNVIILFNKSVTAYVYDRVHKTCHLI